MNVPNTLKWLVALLIIGGSAELLATHVSAYAGYGLVFIVIFAYASDSTNRKALLGFFRSIGIISK